MTTSYSILNNKIKRGSDLNKEEIHTSPSGERFYINGEWVTFDHPVNYHITYEDYDNCQVIFEDDMGDIPAGTMGWLPRNL